MNHQATASRQVVTLCFHGIGTPTRLREADEDLYWVKPEHFDGMLDVVAEHPFMRITFDDGNVSDVTRALPALIARGLCAEFFLVAGRIGRPGYVSPDDVHTMLQAGMRVGAHGMTHRPLRGLDEPELELELDSAAGMLADLTGGRIESLACPYGSYDRRVLLAARRCGFSRVYTVDGTPRAAAGRADAWLQPRYTVRSCDTVATVLALAARPHGHAGARALRRTKTLIKRWR